MAVARKRKQRRRTDSAQRPPHLSGALDVLTLGHRAPLPPALAAAAGEALSRARPWLRHASVQGMGIGGRTVNGKGTGELVLKVYVDRKLPLSKVAHPAPKTIKLPGISRVVEIDVEEIGRIGREATLGGARSYAAGDEIGLASTAPVTGTLGCVVRKRSDAIGLYILSNAHVIANCALAAKGERVLRAGSPGAADLFASYAECVEFLYSADGYFNQTDAALARLDDPAAASVVVPQIGPIAGVSYDVAPGDRVRLVGASSGLAEGFVKDIDFRFAMQYPLAAGGSSRVGFRDQVLCSDYTKEGDSGALVMNADGNAVGLHFAGSNDGSMQCSVFSPIGPVLAELQIDIVTDPVLAPAPPAAAQAPGADPGLAARVAALASSHNSNGGVSWRLVRDGLAVDGRIPTTGGQPVSAARVWSTWGGSISRWANHFGVPVELIIATILTETNGRADAVRQEPGYMSDDATPQKVSPGLMQTLISTARDTLQNRTLDRGWLLVPDHSIQAGTSYIQQQSGATNFDPPLVACAYNAGGIYADNGPANRWRIRQYPIGSGDYADRFVSWFNDCFRMFAAQADTPPMSLYAALRERA